MIVFALALALQSDPPPFIQYLEEAEALGRATFLAGVCEGLGVIKIDRDAVTVMLDAFEDRAIAAKTSGGLLVSAMDRGGAMEKEAHERLLDLGPKDDAQARRARAARLTEYFGDACGDLTVDYPEAFTLPAES